MFHYVDPIPVLLSVYKSFWNFLLPIFSRYCRLYNATVYMLTTLAKGGTGTGPRSINESTRTQCHVALRISQSGQFQRQRALLWWIRR